MSKDLLSVGDKLHINTGWGINWFVITRVTKTLAMSKNKNGYEHKFKREISSDMSHPKERWNTVTYTVEKKREAIKQG